MCRFRFGGIRTGHKKGCGVCGKISDEAGQLDHFWYYLDHKTLSSSGVSHIEVFGVGCVGGGGEGCRESVAWTGDFGVCGVV